MYAIACGLVGEQAVEASHPICWEEAAHPGLLNCAQCVSDLEYVALVEEELVVYNLCVVAVASELVAEQVVEASLVLSANGQEVGHLGCLLFYDSILHV